MNTIRVKNRTTVIASAKGICSDSTTVCKATMHKAGKLVPQRLSIEMNLPVSRTRIAAIAPLLITRALSTPQISKNGTRAIDKTTLHTAPTMVLYIARFVSLNAV